MTRFALAIVCLILSASTTAFAACPVGKSDGDTWCENGTEWKCEKCGSEYCPIITGNKCLRDTNTSGQLPLMSRIDQIPAPMKSRCLAVSRAG